MRKAVGKGDDIIPSTKKLGGPGSVIVMPVTNKNRIWNFDDMDAAEITIPDADRMPTKWWWCWCSRWVAGRCTVSHR